MKKTSYIAIGGLLGTLLRFQLKDNIILSCAPSFPFHTLLINISGSFLLTFFLTFAVERWKMDTDIRLGVATGFFGAYTTFSTFCKDSVLLLNQYDYATFLLYQLLSVLLGLSAAWLGILLARRIITLRSVNQPPEPTAINEPVIATTEGSL